MQIVDKDEKRLSLYFKYNKDLVSKVRGLVGAEWNPSERCWNISKNERNYTTLRKIMGLPNRFDKYYVSPKDFKTSRELVKPHQNEMVNWVLTYRQTIIAGEMGTGKTLAFIEAAELSGFKDIWYVGPKSGVKATSLELEKWGAKFKCKLWTYNALTDKTDHLEPPEFLFLDESSYVKEPASQRTKRAMEIAAEMYKIDPNRIVMLASGTPSPKDPTDWYGQCEIIAEGFIPESTKTKLGYRLSNMEKNDEGYFERVSWNTEEIEKFTKEIAPLRIIKLKKDVAKDLPDKIYRTIQAKPTVDMLRAQKMLRESGETAIQILTKLRTISDGFLYEIADDPKTLKKCPRCLGAGSDWDPQTDDQVTCPQCNGEGQCASQIRTISTSFTPKDEILKDLLDENADIGRIIVWGGFTGTIDRLEEIIRAEGWKVITVDGRGYRSKDGDPNELLKAMDASHENAKIEEKICFLGHPAAGGMGLTLTASHVEIFYSNDFSGGARFQAEDRFHRIGMRALCPTIIDILCLPCDKLVLENLKEKRDLQNITLENVLAHDIIEEN